MADQHCPQGILYVPYSDIASARADLLVTPGAIPARTGRRSAAPGPADRTQRGPPPRLGESPCGRLSHGRQNPEGVTSRPTPHPRTVLGYRKDGRPIHPILGADERAPSNGVQPPGSQGRMFTQDAVVQLEKTCPATHQRRLPQSRPRGDRPRRLTATPTMSTNHGTQAHQSLQAQGHSQGRFKGSALLGVGAPRHVMAG